MTSVLKLSDAVSIGFHVMVILAGQNGELITTKDASSQLMVSEAHLSKVMQRLSKEGLVKSVRGPGGGFQLAGKSDEINLLQVYEAIDGPLVEDKCLLHREFCERKTCIMCGVVESVNKQIRDYFTKTHLADITE